MLANPQLESISLFLDEIPVLKGPNLTHLLKIPFEKYRAPELWAEEKIPPFAWNMPEVFRKKLTAYSEFYFNEVAEQNRLAGIVRYNFSDGSQISARDILRHPSYKFVPSGLLPQPPKAQVESPGAALWPLTQQRDHLFASQNLREVEGVLQVLLEAVAVACRQKNVEVYLQTTAQAGHALRLSRIDFDPATDLDWRVEFAEKTDRLEGEFKLISAHSRNFFFFESFALEPQEGVLLVHAWLREWAKLRETARQITEREEGADWENGQGPTLITESETEGKLLLKYLRSRSIPVRLSAGTQTLSAGQSLVEIHFEDSGDFQIFKKARVRGQKDLSRRGFSAKTILFLRALSEGIPYFLDTPAVEIAGRSGRKREWDLKLLRHLGVLQYVFMETLSFHYDGALTDGREVKAEEILPALYGRLQPLLIASSGGWTLNRDIPLTDLCSRQALACFDEFVGRLLKTLQESDSYFSEAGEVILEGIVDKEMRLVYEMLKRAALDTAGDVFRKSRSPFLERVWTGNWQEDAFLEKGFFHLARAKKDITTLQQTLETLQPLIPLGFQLFYRQQPLQELNPEDFQVNFDLQADQPGRNFNWFELNPQFFLRGEEIEASQLKHFGSTGVIEYAGKIYLVPRQQMPSLRRLENFWQKLQKGKKDSASRGAEQKVYQLPRHQILELLALRASGYAIRGDENWKRICEFYDNLGRRQGGLRLPKSVKAELKPYQEDGVQWLQDLYQLRLGALLADDMGLGKTLQTLSFLEDLRTQEEMGQVLIVVPSSLIFNWQSEVEKFTPELPLAVFSNRDRENVARRLEAKESLAVITTYGLLMEHESFLSQYHWKVLIFDEAQNLKNISTKRTSAARALKAHFKICLTGTPMENHYGEFYSLVDLIVPGSLGRLEDFRRQFVLTDLVSREEIEDLKLKIRPLLLRRSKKEILDQLPEKQETKVSIAFEEEQKRIYRDIALAYNQRVQETLLTEGEASVQLQMLTALLRLRQACSDPGALPRVTYDKIPPKLETLRDSLREIVESGESALVFTQFLKTLEHAEEILKAEGIPVFVLHGGVPSVQRQKILADFNRVEGGAVLVMTLKTGGVGLNLTKASYVFHLEPWWNPAVENQATDRAHRLGQSKAVQVFRYIMHESLEEKMEILKDRKDRKFQSLLGEDLESEAELGRGGNRLSREDFDMLLGLK